MLLEQRVSKAFKKSEVKLFLEQVRREDSEKGKQNCLEDIPQICSRNKWSVDSMEDITQTCSGNKWNVNSIEDIPQTCWNKSSLNSMKDLPHMCSQNIYIFESRADREKVRSVFDPHTCLRTLAIR